MQLARIRWGRRGLARAWSVPGKDRLRCGRAVVAGAGAWRLPGCRAVCGGRVRAAAGVGL